MGIGYLWRKVSSIESENCLSDFTHVKIHISGTGAQARPRLEDGLEHRAGRFTKV